jgi:hypothetical protein
MEDRQSRKPESPASPGRPAGAATSTAPHAHGVKAPCTNCGKSALKIYHKISDVRMPSPHTLPDGQTFTHRRLSRAQCEKCLTWQPLIEWYNG